MQHNYGCLVYRCEWKGWESSCHLPHTLPPQHLLVSSLPYTWRTAQMRRSYLEALVLGRLTSVALILLCVLYQSAGPLGSHCLPHTQTIHLKDGKDAVIIEHALLWHCNLIKIRLRWGRGAASDTDHTLSSQENQCWIVLPAAVVRFMATCTCTVILSWVVQERMHVCTWKVTYLGFQNVKRRQLEGW